MDKIQYGVLKIITYSSIYGFPLTAKEIHRRLIEVKASRLLVMQALEASCVEGIINYHLGYYGFGDIKYAVLKRKHDKKITEDFIEENREAIEKFKKLPWIKCICFSGGTAFQYLSNDKIDVDLFVITEHNRVYLLLRLFKWIKELCPKISWLPNFKKLCLNYIVDGESVRIKQFHDLFTAYQIINLKCIHGLKMFDQFQSGNQWVKFYFPNAFKVLDFNEQIEPDQKQWSFLSILNRAIHLYYVQKEKRFSRYNKKGTFRIINIHSFKSHRGNHHEETLNTYKLRLKSLGKS